jgi:hypothetical protein
MKRTNPYEYSSDKLTKALAKELDELSQLPPTYREVKTSSTYTETLRVRKDEEEKETLEKWGKKKKPSPSQELQPSVQSRYSLIVNQVKRAIAADDGELTDRFLVAKLRQLSALGDNQKYVQDFKTFLTMFYKDNVLICTYLENWDALLAMRYSNAKLYKHKHSPTKRKELFEKVQTSIPLVFDDKLHYITLYRNLHTGEYEFDIRKYEMSEEGHYNPTTEGLRMTQPSTLRMIEALTKMYTKWEFQFKNKKPKTKSQN